MKPNQAFPSSYLKAEDLKGKKEGVVVTVAGCQMERLGEDEKPVLEFEDGKKMVLNKTNWGLITEALGSDDTDDWIGQDVTLYCTRVQFKADMVDAIRVALPQPVVTAKPSRPKAAAPTDGSADPREGNNTGWTPDAARKHARGVNSGKVPVGAPAEPEGVEDNDPFSDE